MLNVSPLTKWSSLEYISSEFQDKSQQSIDAGDECKIVLIIEIEMKLKINFDISTNS